MSNEQTNVLDLIDDINKRLDNIQELTAFAIPAYVRFKRKQRVQFNALADRKGISQGRKGGVRRGTVVKTDGFTVKVHLDGYKRAHDYFHGFFEPIEWQRKGR